MREPASSTCWVIWMCVEICSGMHPSTLCGERLSTDRASKVSRAGNKISANAIVLRRAHRGPKYATHTRLICIIRDRKMHISKSSMLARCSSICWIRPKIWWIAALINYEIRALASRTQKSICVVSLSVGLSHTPTPGSTSTPETSRREELNYCRGRKCRSALLHLEKRGCAAAATLSRNDLRRRRRFFCV